MPIDNNEPSLLANESELLEADKEIELPLLVNEESSENLVDSEEPDERSISKHSKQETIPAVRCLEKILDSTSDIEQIEKDLENLIIEIKKNPSLLDKAASAWGRLGIWQQTGAGLVLAGPALVVGFVAHAPLLLGLGAATALVYVTGGVVLNDHYTHDVNMLAKVMGGVRAIVAILKNLILRLEGVCNDLEIEVKRFQIENEKLQKNVEELSLKVDELSLQVKLLIEIKRDLGTVKDGLEHTSIDLKNMVGMQKEAYQKQQQELEEISARCAAHEKNLEDKVAELAQVNQSLHSELEKSRLVAKTMKETVHLLTENVDKDLSQKNNFQAQLEQYMKDKKAELVEVNSQMTAVQNQMEKLNTQILDTAKGMEQLMDRNEMQVKKMESLQKERELSFDKISGDIHGINTFGIFSQKGRVLERKGIVQEYNIPVITVI